MTATGWEKVLMALALLGLVCSCGRATVQLQPEKILAQIKQEEQQDRSRQKLLAQASRSALTDYTDYKVGPEDLLEMEIFGQDNLNREVRVNGQGEVTLPLVGVVKVGGAFSQDYRTAIAPALREPIRAQPPGDPYCQGISPPAGLCNGRGGQPRFL